jgi:phospholipid/cholesterol/gamma-HCH transport system substrate-binding protein
MRLTRGNPYVAGIALLALIAVALLAAAGIERSFGLPFDLSPGIPPSRDYPVGAVFDDAAGLSPGADVVIGGARVGQVTGVRPDHGRALVTMRIQHAYAPLHRGTIASIRYSTLLAEKYVELAPAAGTPPLPPGATIPSTDTVTPVDFDQFLSSLDPQTRQQVRVLVQQLGGGVRGQHAAIEEFLDQLAGLSVESQPTLDTLGARDPQLASITSDLARVSARLASSHQQLGDLVQQTAVVTGTLETNDEQLDELLVHLAAVSDDLDQTLNGNEGNLQTTVNHLEPFLVQLNDTLEATNPELAASQSELIRGFDYLLPFITSAISQQDANGNYLRQFVVVDLCYDTLDRTPSDPQSGCLVPAITGAVAPAPSGAAAGVGTEPAARQGHAACATPSPTPTVTPAATPCPESRPCPSPAPSTPPRSSPSPSPSPVPCPSPAGLLPPLPIPNPISGLLGLLTGGGS